MSACGVCGKCPCCEHERKTITVREPRSGEEIFKFHAGPLPTDYDARKAIPLASVVDYFPDAIVAIATVIGKGQAQHCTTGWDRAKSTDEESTLLRHFLERGTIDTDGVRHSAKVAWRALALLQKEIEAARGDGVISRGSYDSSRGETGPTGTTIDPGFTPGFRK